MGKKKKSKAKRIIWLIVVLLVLAGVVFAVTRHRRQNFTEVNAETGNITTYYSFSGNVAAVNSKTVYAENIMQIKDIKVTQGQSVKKDDVLMTTTTGQNITAPLDGTVSEIDVESGEQKMSGAQLCKVVDYKNLELDVQVDEYDLPSISNGKEATVTLNALNKDVTGKVTEIAREGNNQNGVSYFNAKISLPYESDLRVGMTADAKVLNKSVKNVTILPMSAIQFDSYNKPYVYISDGKRSVKRVDVTLGINDGTNVEIKSGLASGDVVDVPPASSSSATGFGGLRQGSNNKNRVNSANSASSRSY